MTAGKHMQDDRRKLRAQGLRPVQVWIPDTRVPGFAEEARRQSRRVSESEAERREIAFVEGLLAESDLYGD
jgi:hypothetical protein